MQGIEPSKINRNSGALKMNTLTEKEQLIADVITQIRNDLAAEDTAPLEELLNQAPWAVLEAFMPER